MKKLVKVCVAFFLGLALVACSSNTETSKEETVTVPDYIATIEVQDYGTIKVKLLGSKAPISVENFVKLCDEKFYDGQTFHRIIEGFVIQGGEDASNSHATIKGEFSSNGVTNDISHKRGTISMARASDYDGASTQFFIVQKDSSESLDGLYAAFGFVTEGLDVVDAIAHDAKPTDNNGTIAKEDQPIITSIRCEEIKTTEEE